MGSSDGGATYPSGPIRRFPAGMWSVFNRWWHGEYLRAGQRPGSKAIVRWHTENAVKVWGSNAVSYAETQRHANRMKRKRASSIYDGEDDEEEYTSHTEKSNQLMSAAFSLSASRMSTRVAGGLTLAPSAATASLPHISLNLDASSQGDTFGGGMEAAGAVCSGGILSLHVPGDLLPLAARSGATLALSSLGADSDLPAPAAMPSKLALFRAAAAGLKTQLLQAYHVHPDPDMASLPGSANHSCSGEYQPPASAAMAAVAAAAGAGGLRACIAAARASNLSAGAAPSGFKSTGHSMTGEMSHSRSHSGEMPHSRAVAAAERRCVVTDAVVLDREGHSDGAQIDHDNAAASVRDHAGVFCLQLDEQEHQAPPLTLRQVHTRAHAGLATSTAAGMPASPLGLPVTDDAAAQLDGGFLAQSYYWPSQRQQQGGAPSLGTPLCLPWNNVAASASPLWLDRNSAELDSLLGDLGIQLSTSNNTTAASSPARPTPRALMRSGPLTLPQPQSQLAAKEWANGLLRRGRHAHQFQMQQQQMQQQQQWAPPQVDSGSSAVMLQSNSRDCRISDGWMMEMDIQVLL